MDSGSVVEESIVTAEELLNLIEETDTTFANKISKQIFRGVGCETFSLVPSAFRTDGRKFLFELLKSGQGTTLTFDSCSYSKQSLSEAHALGEFYRLAEENGSEVTFVSERAHEVLTSSLMDVTESYWRETFFEENDYLWPQIEFHRILGLAQHYGLPTRLLDWTFNPYVACYFAAASHIDLIETGAKTESFAIWVLSKHAIRILQQLQLNEFPADFPFNIAFISPPYHGNTNLRAQNGCFTLVVANDSKSSALFLQNEISLVDAYRLNLDCYSRCPPNDLIDLLKESSKSTFKKWIVPGDQADPLLYLLSKRGVSAASVFPGFEGVVRAVNHRSKLHQRGADYNAIKPTKIDT